MCNTYNLYNLTSLCFKLLKSVIVKRSLTMNIFTQKVNPLTGKSDWVVQNEDYDYHQEVARSAFADMLHDTERNEKYEQALKIAIDKMHSLGKQANVLDIGTGTGLLAMMAARLGADCITACEAFKPISDCASKILELNNYDKKIKIIPKRSTELTVGEGGDLSCKANILVTEVFDTELIGEGALGTFAHAHKELLEKDCIVVPQSATIYAQIVESPLVQNWNKLKDVYDEEGEILLRVPDTFKNCAGAAAVHDLQLSEIPVEFIKTIISPQPVLRFDWSGKTPFMFKRSTISSVKTENDGTAQAVFMWWDLQMDINNEVILSCAPYWAHPLRKNNKNAVIPWRDHWMQAVYYLPKEVWVNKNDEVNLISCHDEYSIWFNLKKDLRVSDKDFLRPICECGVHVAFSRTRIGQLNDGTRNKKYLSVMNKCVNSDSVALVLSHGFYLGLSLSKLGAKKVYCLEPNSLCRRIIEDCIDYNNLQNIEIIEDVKCITEEKSVNIVFSEPYFLSSILPWDNLLLIYLIRDIKHLLSDDVKIFPHKAIVKAVVMEFSNLYKIRSSLGKCEGFLMKNFDDLIEESSRISDTVVEAQPLWEYPGIALSAIEELATFDFNDGLIDNFEKRGTFTLEGQGKANGIAIWVDWLMDTSSRNIITTGPLAAVQIGQNIKWDVHTRQGVCLFGDKDFQHTINYTFSFNYSEGNINFNYN